MGTEADQPTQKRTPPDWERIEVRYRAGLLSLREIASEDGNVTEAAIRKRAKRDSWTRDLSAKVQQRADELVRKEEVRRQVRGAQEVSAKQEVEIAATALAEVKNGRRTRVRKGQEVTAKLWKEIDLMVDNVENLEQLGELMRKEDDNGVDRLNDTYLKVISLAGRVDSVKKLTEAEAKLAGMEADAWELKTAAGDAPDPDGPDGHGKSDNEIARRLAFALHKGLTAGKGAQ